MEDYQPDYGDKCREMLRSAGFQPGVNARLRVLRDKWPLSEANCRVIDDLWGIYGAQEVME